MNLYDKIFKPKTMRLANGKAVEERASRLPVILLALVAASVLSVKVTGFNLSTLVTRGNQFFVILGQMFPPNASYLSSIWTPLFDTIKMSLLGSFIGSTLAIPFAIVASTIKGRGVSFMEDQAGWHGKAPNDQEYETAMAELRARLAQLEGK